MQQLPINDPEYWRVRAEEARRIAEQLADVSFPGRHYFCFLDCASGRALRGRPLAGCA